MFDDVNSNWKRTTKELFDSGNAYKGAHIAGMLDRLADMDDKLDRIQKSLDEYLETKRQVTRSLGIGVRVRGRIRRAWTSTWRPSGQARP